MTDGLFTTEQPIAPVAAPTRERRGPIMERIEQHFRDHKYESFTSQDLFEAFPDDKMDTIRNAVRKLVKERTIKGTGMIRHHAMLPQPQPIFDVACLTLTLYK